MIALCLNYLIDRHEPTTQGGDYLRPHDADEGTDTQTG